MSSQSIESAPLRIRMATATEDTRLRRSLAAATETLGSRKHDAYAGLADPEYLRAAARSAKREVLERLPELLGRLADQLEATGAQVHWARTDREANEHVLRIARDHGVGSVVKSKSMLSEEIGLNHALEHAGIEVTETDLGEWIIQLADEAPSHIIVPAVHKDRHQIRDALQTASADHLGDTPDELVAFARRTLREKFLAADLGISGVNFAVADTGSLVLVTNEGNGRLATSVPPVHVALLGMERIVENWDQLDLMLALLTRAATGQAITTYVSAITGPRGSEVHGPEQLHVVIVDNGRSEILGTEYSEMLACVRCGACLNACPVYQVTGGHSYGWVYPGPMGAVLTPLLSQSEAAGEVPNASSLCGACWNACPVGIPLQDMLLALRRQHAADSSSFVERTAWKAWAAAWSRPATYRASLRIGSMATRMVSPSRIPGPAQQWSDGRDGPDIARRTFRDLWKERNR